MFKPTPEQSNAIYKDDTNIIVSAGAGSGKTAVLSKRVERKLLENVKINELLILTFTNKAAHEMKDRIRKIIVENKDLHDNLPLLDSSYITTFDSYALSIVKKYNYLLNISKSIKIIPESVISLVYAKYIDEIFDELYEEKNEDFFKLLTDLTEKDDKSIKECILKINKKLDLKYKKKEYLNNYLNDNFNDEKIYSLIEDYTNLLKDKISYINKLTTDLSYLVDTDYLDNFLEVLDPLFNSETYEEIKRNVRKDFKPLRGAGEDASLIKKTIVDELKKLEELIRFEDTKELYDLYKSSYSYVKIIIEIINRLDERVNAYKNMTSSYEYSDIAKMAIRVLDENKDVREELKNYYDEIMVDEYQDTSDLQDDFIKFIDNKNVYMVGDIKQSIYGFRNANPYLFKSKYDEYSSIDVFTKDSTGLKIDLTDNFRSRREVISSINLIFTSLMTDTYGGANFKKDHMMKPGNKDYVDTDQNYDIEILNYELDENSEYDPSDVEIFTIARDIKNKVENKYQIFDKKLRDATYNDFVILVDRTTKFDQFKKIFEFLEIPLTKNSSTNIIDESEILLVKNIVKLLISYKDNNFDTDYKYALTSVLRSYLFSYTDEEIFKMFKDNNFLNNKALDIVKEIGNINALSLNEIINTIIDKFDFYNKIILEGKVDDRLSRLDEIVKLFNSLTELEYDLYEAYDYLDDIINSKDGIRIDDSFDNNNSVKIMTIHASKGLEFPVCYFPFLEKKFNEDDLKPKILYNNKYGIVTPYFKEGIGKLFTRELLVDAYKKEEISEKIRLLYVALTRPKEKIILVTNFKEKMKSVKDAQSFLDLLSLVRDDLSKYITNIDVDKLGITNYDVIKKSNYKDSIEKTDKKVIIKTYNKIVKDTSYKKASKEIHKLITKEEKDKMKFGTDIHEAFEYIDFNNPNYDIVNPKFIESIKYLIDNIDIDKVTNIFKEYEFVYTKDDVKHHGVIDLLLEYDNKYKIIDYKLKNIDDEAYVEQLKEYKAYISSKTDKEVATYLYSIINKELKEINT